MKKQVAIFIIGFVLGAGSVWLFLQDPTSKETVYTGEEQNSNSFISNENRVPLQSAPVTSNRIVIPDQEEGGVVRIQFVSFNQSGWVVIHELLEGGVVGSALGAQRFDQGDYSGGVSLLRVTESGNTYSAILYIDNGDRRFDLGLDLPEMDDTQNPIQTTFSIL